MQLEDVVKLVPVDMHGSGKAYGASSPGRMDVMGGIADYSGARVLQMPIAQRTHVTLTLRSDGLFRVSSQLPDGLVQYQEVTWEDLCLGDKISTEATRRRLAREGAATWAAYVIGCFVVLHQMRGLAATGADISIRSEVPLGKGLSSSAALEVAVMRALGQAAGITFSGTELARLCQQVENQVVGAPCGLMDQLACAHGREGYLLPIVCRPDLLEEVVAIPEDIHFVGIDSGVRHAVTGASYGQVRTAAFMGYSILALEAGADPEHLAQARETADWSSLPYGGYLGAVPVSAWMQRYARQIPEWMSGAAFVQEYGVPIDVLSAPDLGQTYALAACTAHPIYESHRVALFERLLASLPETAAARHQTMALLGELMYQSHQSYSLCGLGHAATDQIVGRVQADESGTLFGAKITGGGSGGTVCILAHGQAGLDRCHRLFGTAVIG